MEEKKKERRLLIDSHLWFNSALCQMVKWISATVWSVYLDDLSSCINNDLAPGIMLFYLRTEANDISVDTFKL